MHQYRVTKYDPKYRVNGAYTREEWTGIADVGRAFAGHTLTMAEYERVEQQHIDFLCTLAEREDAFPLKIHTLEAHHPPCLWEEGQQITLELHNSTNGTLGAVVATSHITAVKSENSQKNPVGIGEKKAEELEWGEWTMDLDVALQKVRDYNSSTGEATSGGGSSLLNAASSKDRAYTLLMLAGSLWCPKKEKRQESLPLHPCIFSLA